MSGIAAAEEIRTGVAQLTAWLAEVDPAVLYEAPSPGEWTVMELLAHTVEFLRYWPPVMAGIAAEPGLPFGRGLDDADRTGYILAHQRLRFPWESTPFKLRAELSTAQAVTPGQGQTVRVAGATPREVRTHVTIRSQGAKVFIDVDVEAGF